MPDDKPLTPTSEIPLGMARGVPEPIVYQRAFPDWPEIEPPYLPVTTPLLPTGTAERALSAVAPAVAPPSLMSPEEMRQTFERMRSGMAELETMEPKAREDIAAYEARTSARRDVVRARSEEAQAIAEARGEQPVPTQRPVPATPDLRPRPWLDPEGKHALVAIAQQLGALAVGIAGIRLRAPVTVLSHFKEAAESWRSEEHDRAEAAWKAWQAAVTQIRDENDRALKIYDLADRQYGHRLEAKRAAVVSLLDEQKMDDHTLTAALMPYDRARQWVETRNKMLDDILGHAMRFEDIRAKQQAAVARAQEAGARRAEAQHRMANADERLALYRRSTAVREQLGLQALTSNKRLTELTKSTQMQDTLARTISQLLDDYDRLGKRGLITATPSPLSEWGAWVARANPAAWADPEIQAAWGRVNQLFSMLDVTFARTEFQDIGVRVKAAFGTYLERPTMMPPETFRGFAAFLAQELKARKGQITAERDMLLKRRDDAYRALGQIAPGDEPAEE